MTLGVGAGQMSRVDSARIASIKAERRPVCPWRAALRRASDGFFPFRDGLDVIIDAGAKRCYPAGRIDSATKK